MELTHHEIWGLIHGVIFGGTFLLAFAGVLAELCSLRSPLLTALGLGKKLRIIRLGTWVMTVIVWLAVISGTYIVYPWYRAKPPADVTDFANYPRSFLLSSEHTAGWHEFGMEWKEHVAWLSPILMTALLFLVVRYGPRLATDDRMRRIAIALLFLAFAAAAIAAGFGAIITKIAPVLQ